MDAGHLPVRIGFDQGIDCPGGPRVFTYSAICDVPERTVLHVTALLHAHRREIGTRRGRRAGTVRTQAKLVSRWFRDDAAIRILAAEAGVAISTCYWYLHEAIDVMSSNLRSRDSTSVGCQGGRAVPVRGPARSRLHPCDSPPLGGCPPGVYQRNSAAIPAASRNPPSAARSTGLIRAPVLSARSTSRSVKRGSGVPGCPSGPISSPPYSAPLVPTLPRYR